MKKVTKITRDPIDFSEHNKLRVAAYCRVSTDSEEQIVSLETQLKHYETTIKANPDWEFAGLYYDEGITGTKKEKRPELLRMIADCERRKIDLIVTKSISRFSRNTTDCLEMVRKLLRLKIFIFFEKENIHTGSMDSELMLSILSGLAENESVSIAENIKWSIKRRVQNGTYKISYAPYGYDIVDGNLITNDAQAEIVQFIFAELFRLRKAAFGRRRRFAAWSKTKSTPVMLFSRKPIRTTTLPDTPTMERKTSSLSKTTTSRSSATTFLMQRRQSLNSAARKTALFRSTPNTRIGIRSQGKSSVVHAAVRSSVESTRAESIHTPGVVPHISQTRKSAP